MSADGDHHYVPRFHLSRWAGPDGKLRQWSRITHNGKLVRKHVAAAATAYVPGLYSLEHVLPEEVQQIETKVFGQIENKASPILDKLIATGPQNLSVEERYWWTMYLHAAILRIPHVVLRMKEETRHLARECLSQDHEEYLALKDDAPERTLLEWAENHSPGHILHLGLEVMVDMLNDDRVIDRIIHFEWIFRDVSASSRSLLLGDNPLGRIGDLFKSRCFISIPLSPMHVFFGTDAPDIVHSIRSRRAREIVNASNVSTLTNAKKFVYGNAEHSFIDRYLLRAPANMGQR